MSKDEDTEVEFLLEQEVFDNAELYTKAMILARHALLYQNGLETNAITE